MLQLKIHLQLTCLLFLSNMVCSGNDCLVCKSEERLIERGSKEAISLRCSEMNLYVYSYHKFAKLVYYAYHSVTYAGLFYAVLTSIQTILPCSII